MFSEFTGKFGLLIDIEIDSRNLRRHRSAGDERLTLKLFDVGDRRVEMPGGRKFEKSQISGF
jgi:hypothetical protein